MLLATRLNRAMKAEQVEWQSMCRGFGYFGMLIASANVFVMLLNEETAWLHGLLVWSSLLMFSIFIKSYTLESKRYLVGNKFKHILIYDYLCRKSNAKEISDEVAERFDRMSVEDRKKIEHKLNIELLTYYVVFATMILLLTLR